jgi:16S rRNA G966 N2-methylase RsmD
MEYHEIANIFPMMNKQEFDDLCKSLSTGYLEQYPIIMYEGKILDGRNRYLACQKEGINPVYEKYIGNSPIEFVIKSNKDRRHLTSSQLAACALTALPILEAEAKKRQVRKPIDSVPEIFQEQKGEATEQAADLFSTNMHYVSDAKKLAEKAPELLEEVKKGELTIPEAKKEMRAIERQAERTQMAEEGAKIPEDERWNVWQANITNWQAPRKYDFIITDPPYPREYLELYSVLAERSVEWLKPGGLLIAMCGQSYLNEIYNRLGEYLEYYWTAAYLTPGQPTPLRQVNVNTTWKPLLIYSNDKYKGKIFGDVFTSPGADKGYHIWGQSEEGMYSIIKQICLPGQWILDPFCGGGTTGIAALQHGCLFDGIDIDIENVNISKARLNDATKT